MKTKCPFSTVFPNELECVYIREASDGLCDVSINPANGDAWCNDMIEAGIEHRENQDRLSSAEERI